MNDLADRRYNLPAVDVDVVAVVVAAAAVVDVNEEEDDDDDEQEDVAAAVSEEICFVPKVQKVEHNRHN